MDYPGTKIEVGSNKNKTYVLILEEMDKEKYTPEATMLITAQWATLWYLIESLKNK